MSKIVVIYFSGYGHTARQAQAVHAGAASVADASLVAIDSNGDLPQEGWDLLAAADAVIFGAPTYMGGPAWQFKKFADASSKPWFKLAWKDKLAAGFSNSASMNGDKFNTITYFITLAMQHGMLWVGTALMPANSKAAQRQDVNYLGSFSGALSQSPADASAEEAPGPGDLETARLLGVRVATLAARMA